MRTKSHDQVRQEVMEVLGTIPDPEMPISIVDLGLVELVEIVEAGDKDETNGVSGYAHAHPQESARLHVVIRILPTFVGCPALPVIQKDIETKMLALDEVASVDVQFIHDPPWSVERISVIGREQLREIGVTVPESGDGGEFHRAAVSSCGSGAVELRTSAVPCPFCHSTRTRLESVFGPTRCKMIYYCDACRNTFEHLKKV